MKVRPGIYDGVPFEEYLEWDAVSRSELVELAKSPLHYKWYSRRGKKPTAAMLLGTAIHDAVLLPDLFDQRYVVEPEVNKRTKAGKAELEAFRKEHEGMTLLSPSDYETCLEVQRRVRESTAGASVLLGTGKSEVSVVWKDEGSGLLCKARLDRYYESRLGPVVVDLKSAMSASPREWGNHAAGSKLHYQPAMYLDGVTAATGREHERFVFVVYEKTPPYACMLAEYEPSDLEESREEYQALLRFLARCKRENTWPDNSGLVHRLRVPAWSRMSRETKMLIEGLE